jgi:hypothetical protein
MRHRPLALSTSGALPVESNMDAFPVGKGRKFLPPQRIETPAQEMSRLIRAIGGKAAPGEKDYQLIDRAVRRMNGGLSGDQQLIGRRARAYWYGEIADVPSHHMDRARALAEFTPIEEAINVLRAAKLRIDNQLEQLLDEVVSGVPNDSVDRRRLADRRGDPVSVRHRVARAPRLIAAK